MKPFSGTKVVKLQLNQNFLVRKFPSRIMVRDGEMAEWLKAAVC
jgi:hypothetical protein